MPSNPTVSPTVSSTVGTTLGVLVGSTLGAWLGVSVSSTEVEGVGAAVGLGVVLHAVIVHSTVMVNKIAARSFFIKCLLNKRVAEKYCVATLPQGLHAWGFARVCTNFSTYSCKNSFSQTSRKF